MANGSCLCNTVKFKTTGDATNMQHCHCSMCRKIHGSQFATYYNVETVEYIAGEKSITEYESSPGFIRAFCNGCGSPLPEKSDGGSGYVIPAGLMDDELAIKPDGHIFVESKADSYTITDTLPQHKHYGDNDDSRVIEVAQPAKKPNAITGGCLCGQVNFEIEGQPNFMMNCHCTRCRKAKGAAHATNAFVDGDKIRWTSGESNVTNFNLPGAKAFGHAFCDTCGSSAPRPRADGSIYNVPVGSLNQAPQIDAKGHIFVGSKADWFELSDDLTHWDEMPT